MPIWGASTGILHLGKDYIKIKITQCHLSPSAYSQVSKRRRAAVAPSPLGQLHLRHCHPRCSQGSPRAGGVLVPRMAELGVGLGRGSCGGVGCCGVLGPWPRARGAACTRLGSFCGGTSFDINIFLLSTRPTFQTMPLASRLPHSSFAILPQPALRRHPCWCCMPGHGAARQGGHPARWHHGDPHAGAQGQSAALSLWLEGGSCFLAPAPALALQGVAGSPSELLQPVLEGAQLCHPFPLPLALFPGTVLALAGKQPCPGTASSRDSLVQPRLVGDILVRAGGECSEAGSSQVLAPGWLMGSVRGPGLLLSPPGASLALGPHMWFIQGRSHGSSHVAAEAVPHSWQLVSGWWD